MARSKLVRDLRKDDRIELRDPPTIGRVVLCLPSVSIPTGMQPPLWLILMRMSDGSLQTAFAHPDASCQISGSSFAP